MADKDVTISRLILQIDLLRSQMFGLEQANAQLQQQIGQLRADNQQLKDQIARLTRDSSKPPSSDIVKPKNTSRPRGRRKRKLGGQPGHPREERTPFGPDQAVLGRGPGACHQPLAVGQGGPEGFRCFRRALRGASRRSGHRAVPGRG